jgi:hypothetical protein
VQHWVVSSRPGYNSGPAGGLGLVLMGSITIGVALATIAFAVVATWWTRKRT